MKIPDLFINVKFLVRSNFTSEFTDRVDEFDFPEAELQLVSPLSLNASASKAVNFGCDSS